ALFMSIDPKTRVAADKSPAVRNTTLYEAGEGYSPDTPGTVARFSKYTPANAGPIAIPMNNNKAPTPVEIPINSLGENETTTFQVEVIVSDNPLATNAKFIDVSSPVE